MGERASRSPTRSAAKTQSQVGAEPLTIGELARRTGVATSALRYYEEVGLLAPDGRESGRRFYGPAAVGTVGVILFLQDVGFSLREMRALMQARRQSSTGWRDLVQDKLRELDARIATARVAHEALDHALRCRHDDIFDCPTFWRVVAGRLAGHPLEGAHQHSPEIASAGPT